MFKIALVAPFEEPVPPRKYGGTERVVSCVAEELVNLGHDVTLFASGDSHTSAKLVACVKKSIRVLPESKNLNVRHSLNYMGLSTAVSHLAEGEFDIVHNHIGWPLLMFRQFIKAPVVTTTHGILSDPTDRYMYNLFKRGPFISISNSQRVHNQNLKFIATVYNGISVDSFSFNNKPQDYLVFLGRIHPHKGPDKAIEVAKKTKRQLIIAAKIDPLEMTYYNRKIKPLIDGKQIKFVGEVNHREKVKLLKNAYAMVSPIQWDEPFGITNIEAMACGTPVLSINRGSGPEIMISGKTGYLSRDIDQMIKNVDRVKLISRQFCRHHVEEHFSARSMALGYIRAYTKVINRQRRLR